MLGKIPPTERESQEKTCRSSEPFFGSFLYSITISPSDRASIQDIEIVVTIKAIADGMIVSYLQKVNKLQVII